MLSASRSDVTGLALKRRDVQDLERANNGGFVLGCDLHTVFLVTPLHDLLEVDWARFPHLFLRLNVSPFDFLLYYISMNLLPMGTCAFTGETGTGGPMCRS